MDDVVIASYDLEEHYEHLRQVFERLAHFDLKMNVNKCYFADSKLTFLGHVNDKHGLTLVPENSRSNGTISSTNIVATTLENDWSNQLLPKIYSRLYPSFDTTIKYASKTK